MAGAVDVYNGALDAIGAKNAVTAAETSVEAQACTRWYDKVRQKVLRAGPWPEAQTTALLTLAVERDTAADWVVTDPPPGWLYAYLQPATLLAPRYLSDYGRFQQVVSPASIKWIVSNTEDAILTYTKDETTVDQWSVELRLAIEYALAAAVCVKLTGKHERLKIVAEEANRLILQARVNDANNQEVQQETVAPWHAARGVDISSGSRYIFPFGPLVNVGNF